MSGSNWIHMYFTTLLQEVYFYTDFCKDVDFVNERRYIFIQGQNLLLLSARQSFFPQLVLN